MLSVQARIKTQTAVPHARLFGKSALRAQRQQCCAECKTENQRKGNCNTQVCVLPRALLDYFATNAQKIFAIKIRRARNRAAVSQDCLLVLAHFVRKGNSLRRMQNTCHPSFQDGLTNILAQTSCHKQIRAFVCDVMGCNFEAARQLQRHKWMLTTILCRFINYGSACLRATFVRLRNRMILKLYSISYKIY